MKSHERFEAFQRILEDSCARAGREVSEIRILPVSKGQNVEKIIEHLRLPGFPQALGENYIEELEPKSQQIEAVEWHYLGALQSRKLPRILDCAQVLHTVSRAKELDLIKKNFFEPIRFFVQVNISSEGQKLGASFDEARVLLEHIFRVDLQKNLLGFMGMASELDHADEKQVREQFASLRKFRDEFFSVGKLSMGMSGDFRWAIAEGSDLIRIGSLLFGERVY